MISTAAGPPQGLVHTLPVSPRPGFFFLWRRSAAAPLSSLVPQPPARPPAIPPDPRRYVGAFRGESFFCVATHFDSFLGESRTSCVGSGARPISHRPERKTIVSSPPKSGTGFVLAPSLNLFPSPRLAGFCLHRTRGRQIAKREHGSRPELLTQRLLVPWSSAVAHYPTSVSFSHEIRQR